MRQQDYFQKQHTIKNNFQNSLSVKSVLMMLISGSESCELSIVHPGAYTRTMCQYDTRKQKSNVWAKLKATVLTVPTSQEMDYNAKGAAELHNCEH